VEPLLPDVSGQIAGMLDTLGGSLPDVAIGPHCEAPYECPFKNRCWPERPRHHVSTLYYIGTRKWELEARGFATVDQVPNELLPHPIAARQKRAIREKRLIVEAGLAEALGRVQRPIAVLDFETVMPAIPVWTGCRPYSQVPVQFSCHVEDGNGGWAHHEWIALDGDDPRPELVREVTAACQGAQTILAYNMQFERYCLAEIRRALPDLHPAVVDLELRLKDALPLVRDYVYHVDFDGSFSLKSVLPVLVPELGYDDLDVGGGMEASRVLEAMLLRREPADLSKRKHLRGELQRYCELDTWGVVKLLDRLRELAGAP
jgi:hypothetical protein